jgi:uridine kinase
VQLFDDTVDHAARHRRRTAPGPTDPLLCQAGVVPQRTLTTTRAAVLHRLADLVPVPEGDGAVRVGIDGVDGAGKTVLADDLAEVLTARGRPVVRVSAVGFHHPRSRRYERGRASPEGFFLDSYDLEALHAQVLAPLGPGGDRRYRTAVRDVASDTALDLPVRLAPPGAVLVLDGLFLHRDELVDAWDLSVFVAAPFAVTFARMAVRDGCPPDPEHPDNQRYVQGQRLYLAAADPARRAGVVVDNQDPDAAVIR